MSWKHVCWNKHQCWGFMWMHGILSKKSVSFFISVVSFYLLPWQRSTCTHTYARMHTRTHAHTHTHTHTHTHKHSHTLIGHWASHSWWLLPPRGTYLSTGISWRKTHTQVNHFQLELTTIFHSRVHGNNAWIHMRHKNVFRTETT